MYSIELTPSNIHIVSGSAGRKAVKIKRAFSTPMPPGAYFNGYIKDYSTVAKNIRDILLSQNIRRGEAYFVMDSTAVKTKEAVVPDENRQNILSILNKEMGDILALEPHIIDYIVTGRFKENKKWYLNSILYALPKDLLMEFLNVSEECGVRLKELEFHHNAIAKLWELCDPAIKKSALEAQVERLQLWVGLYQDSIRMATNAIDGNCYSRTIPIKRSLQDTIASDTETRKRQILFYIDQIQMFLEFIRTTTPDYPLENVQIYGDYDDAEEMCSVLQKQLPYSVERLKRPKQITGITDEEYPVYCSAIGAMLRR